MHGIPEGFDASTLVGRTLVLVSFGEHALILIFDPSVEIHIESSIETASPTDAPHLVEEFALSAPRLLSALGQEVSDAQRVDRKTLELRFVNGLCVRVFDNSESYESFTITIDGEMTVV